MITYNITLHQARAHLFEVTMVIPLTEQMKCPLVLKLPAWIPGSYMIRDFARHIVSIEARVDNQPIQILQKNKHSWEIKNNNLDRNFITIHYQVYAFDLSVRGCFLDDERGFINPAALCLMIKDREKESCCVQISLPKEDKEMQNWQLATALIPKEIDTSGFGLYEAKNYAELIDRPIEMGHFRRLTFEAEGIPHEIILSGVLTPETDFERLKNDTKKICETEIKMFEGKTSFERYSFLLHVSDNVYGGLEHQTSTALLASRECLPTKNMQAPSEDYIQLLGLISHEYFHAWNVKAIKPEYFVDYDLDKEVYTEQLWAFEGITSYYDDLILLRSGLITKEKYLNILAQNITKVARGSGQKKQTLTESSFNAWTKFYKQDENSVNAIVSYYQKGALFALCLDLFIRSRTNQEKTLDDVMRFFYQAYCSTGEGIPEKMWQEKAAQYLGVDLTELFNLGLYTTQDLPLDKLLHHIGINYYWTRQEISDLGGFQYYPPSDNSNVIDLGMKYQNTPSGLKILQTFDHGAAQEAGLNVGDEIVAINALKITEIKKQLQYFKLGQDVVLHLFRNGVLKNRALRLKKALPNTCHLCADRLDEIEWLKK